MKRYFINYKWLKERDACQLVIYGLEEYIEKLEEKIKRLEEENEDINLFVKGMLKSKVFKKAMKDLGEREKNKNSILKEQVERLRARYIHGYPAGSDAKIELEKAHTTIKKLVKEQKKGRRDMKAETRIFIRSGKVYWGN